MNLSGLKVPRFSPRFFIYFLLGVVILVLATEGWYYFWSQRKLGKQSQNPAIVHQEGPFSYIKLPDGSIEKMILGSVEGASSDELTIRTEDDIRVKVKYSQNEILIHERPINSHRFNIRAGSFEELLPGDTIRLSEIETDDKDVLFAGKLIIIRWMEK